MSNIDPLVGLAFSVYSAKGVYALLLGSGISRAAHIPTGWEVTLDLIRKIAAAEACSCEPDPAVWYRKKFGLDADYSDLLEKLALTPAERAKTLAAYFEPTIEERSKGKKQPTKAHRLVAKLVASGYIRVIITTNFDRLMEQALEAEGISPSVIASSDAVVGSMPLVHSRCTLIKVHGDYLDTRIKNTVNELATYDTAMDSLLDRVFDEYGLIVCGWSATWDSALRQAIRRSPNRRFSLWWAARGIQSDEAKSLLAFRSGTMLSIESADNFLNSLWEKIDALERFNAPHPLSSAIAVASLKKFLMEDRYRIELQDLILKEVNRQIKILEDLPVPPRDECGQYLGRLEFYNSSLEIVRSLLINGCYWSRPEQNFVWLKAIERLADSAALRSQPGQFHHLRKYPAFLLMYASGLAAITANNYSFLQLLFRQGKTSVDMTFEGRRGPLIKKISTNGVFESELLKRCQGQNYYTPVSEYMHGVLREPFRELLPNDYDFDLTFDKFEYLLALSYLKMRIENDEGAWAPIGRFGYRRRNTENDVSTVLLSEWQEQGPSWGPITSGVFPDPSEFVRWDKMLKENVLVHFQAW